MWGVGGVGMHVWVHMYVRVWLCVCECGCVYKFYISMQYTSVLCPLQESPDRKTYYVKVHGTYPALLRGAEELLLRMPIRVRATSVVPAV